MRKGLIVTVTLNGKNHTATVGSDGSWAVTLPASGYRRWLTASTPDGKRRATKRVMDPPSPPISRSIPQAPVVTINTVAGDDILNTSEQGQAQIISAGANGAAEGDVVTVTVGGKTFTGVVQ